MTRRRRAWWWWAGAALAAVLLGLAAGELAGWPFLRQPLQKAMAAAAGVPVELGGGFHARLLSRHLQVEHLRVAAANGFAVPHLVNADAVELDWTWGDLWRWRQGQPLRLESVRAGVLDAHLARDSQGRASWQLGKHALPTTSTQPHALGLPKIGLLEVQRGVVEVDDNPTDTRLRIELSGGEDSRGTAGPAGGYRASVKGRYRALPLNLQVRSASALPFLQEVASPTTPSPMVAVRVEGEAGAARLLFDGQAGALLGERRLQGALRLRAPSMAEVAEPFGLTLPRTPPFELDGQLGHDAGVWHLKADRALIGHSLLAGDFRFAARSRPTRLTGTLTGRRLALADLGPAVGVRVSAAKPGRGARPDRVLPQRRLDLPSLRAMDAEVNVAIDELDFGTAAMASLRQLRTRVLLQAGVLQLQSLQAVVAGGQFGGTTRLDSVAEPARWTLDLRFDGIDVAGWFPGLRTTGARAQGAPPTQARPLRNQRLQARQGGNQPVLSYLTGTIGGSLQATGAGRSTAEILGSLDGRLQLNLRDGTVSHLLTEALGLDLAQALGVLVRGDRPLPLRCARIDVGVEHGVAKTRLAVIDNADSTVRVAGQVDLRDESLNLKAVARPKDTSPLSLRSPITITGRLAHPVVDVESGPLARKLLGAAALSLLAGPLAALLPLIDTGTGQVADPCAEAPTGGAKAASGTPRPSPPSAPVSGPPRPAAARR